MCDDQLLEMDNTPYSYTVLLQAIFAIFVKGRHWTGVYLLLELTMVCASPSARCFAPSELLIYWINMHRQPIMVGRLSLWGSAKVKQLTLQDEHVTEMLSEISNLDTCFGMTWVTQNVLGVWKFESEYSIRSKCLKVSREWERWRLHSVGL